MAAFLEHDLLSGVSSQVSVWHCDGCRCTHIRAGKALLTFTPAEFATFVESINKSYRQQHESDLSDDTSEETPEVMINSAATN